MWTYIGLGTSAFALLYAIMIIFKTMLFGIDVPGYASLMVSVMFIGGIQLIGIGVLGEYIGRIYHEVKRRPVYLVRESRGASAAAVAVSALEHQQFGAEEIDAHATQ